jgi:4-hydroxy-3-polyprenylbenzoate decarboxylase
MATPRRLIVAITGASGFVYGVRLLQMLQPLYVETHLIVSKSAQITMACETQLKLTDVTAMADRVYRNDDIAACISSGSFRTLGMVIAPCSMKTLAEIACGTSSCLIARAADVVLKERKRLVLMARETPLTLAHLRNMTAVTEMGAIVAPPVPAFYAQPKDLEHMVDHTVGRVLDLFDIDVSAVRRWTGPVSGRSSHPPQDEREPHEIL